MVILSSFLIVISVEGDFLLEDHPTASFDWHLLPGDTSTLFLSSWSS